MENKDTVQHIAEDLIGETGNYWDGFRGRG